MDIILAERPRTAPRTVTGSMLFLEHSPRKPLVAFGENGGELETNAVFSPHEVSIRDARPGAEKLRLDIQGFELLQHRSVTDFDDEDFIIRSGHLEAANLVREATGAAHVFVFDQTIRRRANASARQPSTRVHVDYTATSAPARLRQLLGPEAEDFPRFAFINVWRPIRWPASDWPLVLADARSIAPDDLIATDIFYPDRKGEIYSLRHAPGQDWAYVPDMQLDEALLIKCYDLRPGVARFTPHTAFADPNTPADAPPRESIEFRTIALFD